MKLKPVKQKFQPSYPTLDTYINEPKLLMYSLPRSWRLNKIVAPLMAVFISCSSPEDSPKLKKTEIELIAETPDSSKDQETVINQYSAKIAPIFTHGKGTGGLGCVSIAPPGIYI